jgi:hypothetical protein
MKRQAKTPRAKTGKKAKSTRTPKLRGSEVMAILTLILSISMLGGLTQQSRGSDDSDLRVIQARIDEFMILHGSTPRTSAELKAYMRSERVDFEWHGRSGIPAEYIRIGTEYYLLQRPIPGIHDELDQVPAVYRLPKILSSTVGQQFNPERLGVYPPALLLGVDSPDKQYHARVLIDHESSRRFLIVTDNSRIDRAWVAPHDFVEEFFWLPQGDRIVYTATSSARYDDGIYTWQPQSNDLRNLLRDKRAASTAMVAAETGPRAFTLLGVSESEVFFVDQPQQHEFALPQDFYHSKLVERAGFGGKERAGEQPENTAISIAEINRQIKWEIDPQASQTEHARLLRLSVEGDLTDSINRWQGYCQEQKRTVVYPYCLWVLQNMYLILADAWDEKSQEATIARAYALEFAKAIAEQAEAPRYLRRLARNAVDVLLAGEILAPEFGRFK